MAIRDLFKEWEKKVLRARHLGKKTPGQPKRRWMADTYVGGDRRFKAFTRKSDAEAWIGQQRRLEVEGELGIRRKPRIGFRSLARKFLQEKESQRTPRTFRFYLHQIRASMAPFFDEMPLDGIGREDIVRYMEHRLRSTYRGEPIHKRTVNKELATLRRIFKYARINGYLVPDDPTEGILAMKAKPKKKIRFLSNSEIEAFLGAVGDPKSFTFLLTAVETGMRRGELWHFRWDWIDWTTGMIRVTQNEEFSTKSHEDRSIPMTRRLRDHLAGLDVPRVGRVVPPSPKARGRGNKTKALVYRQYQRHLHEAIQKAGLEHFTLHDLRHTYASRLVRQGVDLYTVAKLLGHQDIKTTQIYAHLAPDQLKRAVALLDVDGAGTLEGPPDNPGK